MPSMAGSRCFGSTCCELSTVETSCACSGGVKSWTVLTLGSVKVAKLSEILPEYSRSAARGEVLMQASRESGCAFRNSKHANLLSAPHWSTHRSYTALIAISLQYISKWKVLRNI